MGEAENPHLAPVGKIGAYGDSWSSFASGLVAIGGARAVGQESLHRRTTPTANAGAEFEGRREATGLDPRVQRRVADAHLRENSAATPDWIGGRLFRALGLVGFRHLGGCLQLRAVRFGGST